MAEFVGFPKIARYNRDILITEKIDGTNAAVIIEENVLQTPELAGTVGRTSDGAYIVSAQSRNRLLSLGKSTDNFGFAQWVEDNKDALAILGPGHHYGEWYGQGIQRTYGLKEKRFALFNVLRWQFDEEQGKVFQLVKAQVPGLELVPVLYRGERRPFGVSHYIDAVDEAIRKLRNIGSLAVPFYMGAEGIVLFHTASRQSYKVTLENDEAHKGTYPGMHNQKEEHDTVSSPDTAAG